MGRAHTVKEIRVDGTENGERRARGRESKWKKIGQRRDMGVHTGQGMGRQVENKNKIETWKSQYVVVCRHEHNIITQRKESRWTENGGGGKSK